MILMILTLNPMGLNQTHSSQSYAIKTDSGELLYLSRQCTLLLDFICASKAGGSLAKDLLLSHKAYLENLLTFRISPKEFLLGMQVRSMGAQNNNPYAIQLKAALRRLLAKQSVTCRSMETLLIVKRTQGFVPCTSLRKA